MRLLAEAPSRLGGRPGLQCAARLEAQLAAAEPLKREDGADGRHFCAPAVLGPSPALAETFNGRRAVIIDGDTFGLGLERVRIGARPLGCGNITREDVDVLVRVLNQCITHLGRAVLHPANNEGGGS